MSVVENPKHLAVVNTLRMEFSLKLVQAQIDRIKNVRENPLEVEMLCDAAKHHVEELKKEFANDPESVVR